MCVLVCYMFYKNIAFVLTQYWYQIYTGWSGQKFILEAANQSYNIVSGCDDLDERSHSQ
jgi:phospholipid-transporting ATPase